MKSRAQQSKGCITLVFKLSDWYLLAMPFIATLGLVHPLPAQSSPGDTASLRSMMAEDSARGQDIQERLDALIKTTQQARQERQSAAEQSARPGNSDVWVPGGGDVDRNVAVEDEKPSQSADSSSRSMSEIRERIRILQRLRRDRLMSTPSQQSPQIPGGTGASALATPGGDVSTDNRVQRPDAAVNPSDPTLSSIDDSLVNPATVAEASEIDSPDAAVAAERILPKPVNTMALGESLYRTGNYESALKAFRSVPVDGLSQSDRTWLDLLIALCQRKLGDFEKSQGTLREIANEESTDYPVKAAKWWLKYAETSDGSQIKFNRVSADFGALLERSEKYVTQ